MAKSQAQDVSLSQALNLFSEHLHLSGEILEALLERLDGKLFDPENHRRDQDTIMEFGFLPPGLGDGTGNGTGGGHDGDLLLEGSKILTEGPGVPIGLET